MRVWSGVYCHIGGLILHNCSLFFSLFLTVLLFLNTLRVFWKTLSLYQCRFGFRTWEALRAVIVLFERHDSSFSRRLPNRHIKCTYATYSVSSPTNSCYLLVFKKTNYTLFVNLIGTLLRLSLIHSSKIPASFLLVYVGTSSSEAIKIFPLTFYAYSLDQSGFLVTHVFQNGSPS